MGRGGPAGPDSKEKCKQRSLGRFIFKISATLVIDRVRDLSTKRIPTKEDAERPWVRQEKRERPKRSRRGRA